MKLFFFTIVVWLALEGALFALCPGLMRSALEQMAALEPAALRNMGIGALVASLALGMLGKWLFS